MRKRRAVLYNLIITIGIMGMTFLFCIPLQHWADSDTHVPLLFVLAVLLVSRFTDGYKYGIIASLVAVVGVNYAFTYPYFALNFTIAGYPLTFLAMLVVSTMVSTLTTQIKHQEQIRLEVEKEKMRGNLLRAVSHDIRTPLTSIVGSASAIQDNYKMLPEDQVLELVNDVKEEAQWLIRIVENLLSVTRIGSENAKIKTEDEVVEEIVSSAVIKFQKRFPGIEVVVEEPEDFLMVPMDGILIEQVLVNLLENAAIHGKTVRKIHIVLEREEDRVFFYVRDDGKGIDEAVLPKIFEGNLQAREGQESDSKKNMGIGLSVCMSIVKAHKGNMKAENMKQGGAQFVFWLPAEKENHGY